MGLSLQELVKDCSKLLSNQHTLDITTFTESELDDLLNDRGKIILKFARICAEQGDTTPFGDSHYPKYPTNVKNFAVVPCVETHSADVETFVETDKSIFYHTYSRTMTTSPVVFLKCGENGFAVTHSGSLYLLSGVEMTVTEMVEKFPLLEPYKKAMETRRNALKNE